MRWGAGVIRSAIYAVLFTVVLGFCYVIGYVIAHSEVARECERLGSFYVGDKIFKCSPTERVTT
jgi:hypothetical protein